MQDEIGGVQMTNEEFRKMVLEELRSLKEGQRNLEEGRELRGEGNLEEGQRNLEEGQRNLEEGQREIKKELQAITEQTADLTEFREETNAKLDTIIEENEILKELIGKHEVDIRRIQKKNSIENHKKITIPVSGVMQLRFEIPRYRLGIGDPILK